MNWHRSSKFLGLLTLLVLILSALPIVAAQGPGATGKIEPALLEKLVAAGEADLVLTFAEQADLSPAYQMTWEERGEFVVSALTEVAERSQIQAKAYLDRAGLRYQTFIAGNELYVWAGDARAATSLAAFPEVAGIRATRVYPLDPVLTVDKPAAPQATLAWGIADTGADDFWSTFGFKGEGIIVANIDTGVQWNHPALVNQFKCPGDPGNAACWKDPTNVCTGGSPCDKNGHGTHTMGTMVADDDPGLPYIAGMAPGARWIACKGCQTQAYPNSCPEYALNACADWILQPGGSTSNRPHVVNNSWGGPGCDTWYLARVNAWRAAGIFPAFSAGNGSGCSTLSSPGNYQESFASAAHSVSRSIADFSSRGPNTGSGCDPHTPYTKPNLSAPGVSIVSTYPTNGWASYNGTSMASPHSAGAVALLWSCQPTLVGQIDQTFQLLQNSADAPPAGNCGAPLDTQGNYTYGYGYLNVLAAGQATCPGYLDGHVYISGTTTPIEGAGVRVSSEYPLATTTESDGYYTLTLVAGTYNVVAHKSGYLAEMALGVVVDAAITTTQDFYLQVPICAVNLPLIMKHVP